MSGAQKSVSIAAVLVISIFLLTTIGLAGFYFSTVSHVMTKTSPDGRHSAKLHRYQAIDVNFNVSVDGTSVFYSPDFAPVDADFREQIAWTSDGKIVVLEVGGKRLFGFHVVDNRSLTDEELLTVGFTPFDELGFEGTLPTAPSAE